MLRVVLYVPAIALIIAPAFVQADATVSYKTETVNSKPAPASHTTRTVVYMKGNKGVTVNGDRTMIVDFARAEVTLVDTRRNRYSTFLAAEYGSRMAGAMSTPNVDLADSIKSTKTSCTSGLSGRTEVIQGVQAEERQVTCSMAVPLADSVSQQARDLFSDISMKVIVGFWTPTPAEKLRAPALWQLSGLELWQRFFMNPSELLSKSAPGGMAPVMDEVRKNQSSAALRSTMELYTSLNMRSGASVDLGSNSPITKVTQEVEDVSTAPLDDSLFNLPADCTLTSFEELMSGFASTRTQPPGIKSLSTIESPGIQQPAPVTSTVLAYVPFLTPLLQTGPEFPDEVGAGHVEGRVEVLVTVGIDGKVQRAEALTGPEALRKAATDAVMEWTFRPVIRNGSPVTAYTDATVDFVDPSKGSAGTLQFGTDMAAIERRVQLARDMPRSAYQVFLDLEQDAGGDGRSRRFGLLGPLAIAAVKAGVNEKANAYASELLTASPQHAYDPRYGDAIHNGHMVLGLVALGNDDVPAARLELLEAGKTPGSQRLNSFGPIMMLASEMLQRGEREPVLEYFELCRKFWTMGTQRLALWTDMVRRNEMPDFGPNLH